MLPKFLPKPLFQALGLSLLLIALGLTIWWTATNSGLYARLAQALTWADGTYDPVAAFLLTLLLTVLPAALLVLLLRPFARMPDLKTQLAADPILSHLSFTSAPDVVPDPTLASPASRLLAFVIDRTLVGVVLALASGITAFLLDDAADTPSLYAVELAGFLVLLAVCIVYAWARDGLGGRSLARLWLRQRVVDATTREPIGFWRSFKRELMLHVGPLAILELILLFTRPDRRRLGDQWARTLVIRDP